MMKRIVILCMFVFFLCGCTAEVDIKVDKYSIDETISITEYATATQTKDMVFSNYRKYMPVDNSVIIVDTEPDEKKSRIHYYDRTHTDLGNGYNFRYNYNYDFDEYSNSKSLNTAFKSSFVSYNKKDKIITISTDSSGTTLFEQYKQLDSLKVNLTSDYEVINSNADVKNGKVHTWNLSRTNNKAIYIEYRIPSNTTTGSNNSVDTEIEEDVDPEEEEENESDISTGMAFLIVIAGIVGFILIVLVISKFDRRNYR